MSKKQQPTPSVVNHYEEDRTAAKTPSPYEEALSRRNMGIINWAEKGDYTKPPSGVFFNFTDPAIRKQQREMISSAGPQGIVALGGQGNSSLLQLNKQILDDQFERDQAENYQDQVGSTVAGAYAGAGQLMDADMQRKLSLAGMSGNIYNSELNRVNQRNMRPRWWEVLMNGAQRAAETYATAGAGGGG